MSLVERRAKKIANARSVTLGMASTFLLLAFAGALLMRLADPHNFPSVWLAVWWAIQTVTTVGYGDVVPTTASGRILAGTEMVIGVSFIAFLTAAVTSTVIERSGAEAKAAEAEAAEKHNQALIDAMTDLGKRLERIEARLPE